jgi:hypothetical protein
MFSILDESRHCETHSLEILSYMKYKKVSQRHLFYPIGEPELRQLLANVRVVEIVGSNFFWIRTRSITLFRTRTRTRTRLIKLIRTRTRTRTRTFYSFKNVLIFSKFFSNLKLSVGLKIQDAFIRLLIWKLAHLVYFSGNFEGDFIKIKSYFVLFMRRRSSGPK